MKTRTRSYLLLFVAIILSTIIAVFLLKTKQQESAQPTGSSPQKLHQTVWQPRWRETAPLTIPRRALAAAIHNDHIYAVGGIGSDGQYIDTVEYARILPDGSLQRWQTTSRLNEGRFYLAAAAVNGYLYAIGGARGELGNNNIPVATVERAKVNGDGSLQSWEFAQPLTTPRRGLTVNQNGNQIIALGGYNGAFLHSIEHTTVNHNGVLGSWKRSPHEAKVDRYIHSSAITGEYLYLLAGHMKNSKRVSYGDVEVSRVVNGGGITPWRVEPSNLLQARFIATAFSLGNYLYIAAGHDGANRLSSVEFAQLDSNGGVGRWNQTAPLNTPRSGTAAVTHNNRAYILGGIYRNDVLNSVETAAQASDGNLGSRIATPDI